MSQALMPEAIAALIEAASHRTLARVRLAPVRAVTVQRLVARDCRACRGTGFAPLMAGYQQCACSQIVLTRDLASA